MQKIKTKKSISVIIMQTKIKIKVCWYILTGKYEHWFICNLPQEELVKLFKDDSFDADLIYCGMQPYIFMKCLKYLGDGQEQCLIDLEKIEFEHNAKNDEK